MLKHWWDICGIVGGLSIWACGFEYFLRGDFYVFLLSLGAGTYMVADAIKGIRKRNLACPDIRMESDE